MDRLRFEGSVRLRLLVVSAIMAVGCGLSIATTLASCPERR